MDSAESPFQQPRPRLSFGLDWVLLVVLVAATSAALLGYAMYLPAVASEVNAWLGRAVGLGGLGEGRRVQFLFLLACYASPLVLSVVARLVYLAGQALVRPRADAADDEFRME